MNVEILIHGVPDGQDYYGIDEERAYAELFYDNSAESVKFVVETKEKGNNAFVYYTYLRYKGLVGSGGRPGSYFGLTLRLDKYYQDVTHIYNMLEMTFKKYVVGVFLSPLGGSYKYLVPNFASKKAEIEQLHQGLAQLIQCTSVWPKFVDVDKSIIHPEAPSASCNIEDISENTMAAALKKYSKVVLSPDYKSNVVKEYEKKIQEAEGKGGNIVAEKDQKIAEKDGEISSLKSTVTTQKAKIDALQTENLQLKKNGNLTQMISGIKDPINSLADYFHVQNSQKEPRKPSYGFKNFILGIVGCVLSAIIIALCIVSLTKTPKGQTANGQETALAQQVELLTNENNQLKSEISEKNKTISDLRNQQASNIGGQTGMPTTTQPAKTKLKIDVEGYSTGAPIYCDKIYTIKVLDEKNKTYSGDGTWAITNATIKQGKATDSQIKIQPTSAGKVTISYASDNCMCNPREFTSEQQKQDVSFEIVVSPEVSEVEVGKEYAFSVSGYEGKGTWRLDGFDTNDDKSGRQIKVTANANGSGDKATISYTPEGGSKKSMSFKYKANE